MYYHALTYLQFTFVTQKHTVLANLLCIFLGKKKFKISKTE